MNRSQSQSLFKRAARVLPGGVDSPVRAFRGVGGTPPFIARADGARVFDADGNEYIDYVGSWGPMILGHNAEPVRRALAEALGNGTSFGAPTELEIILGEMVIDAVPSVEMVRFVSSGTEATMSALRLARGFTGRDLILKFDGCYHGHGDSLLVKAGSGAATLGVPDSAGVPSDIARNTLTCAYNDLDAVRELVRQHGDSLAAIIVEPVAGNMGLVKPATGFLEGLRELCSGHGIVLIFDEVMTGFRVAYGGYQSLCGITPDLTTLGKVIGGGLPVGAYGGRRDIMEKIAPLGPVYQAGTLSGNPLAMTAGIATLTELQRPGVYERLEKLGNRLAAGLKGAATNAHTAVWLDRQGSMSCMYFRKGAVRNYADAVQSDTKLFARYFHAMLDRGIYLAPSQFEAGFISLAHTDEDIDRTVQAAAEVLGGSPPGH
ncbi:MAG: glutamate-1-semialdehyde 2,1-aminomutase [Nitrospirota bacterium]|nr:glutamate-1-semialdehyde 2,1-aminomutase [Nitrospirota bacterium]